MVLKAPLEINRRPNIELMVLETFKDINIEHANRLTEFGVGVNKGGVKGGYGVASRAVKVWDGVDLCRLHIKEPIRPQGLPGKTFIKKILPAGCKKF